MSCREAILSNDYLDYIWKIDATAEAEDLLPPDVCYQAVNREFGIFYLNREEVLRDPGALPIGDYAFPVCHTDLDMESLEASRILMIQNQPALQLKGSGVIIGFLDSGIALEQPVFRTSDGRTRILELWDQTDQEGTPPDGMPPDGMQYGSVYKAGEIDRMLQEGRTDLPGADENGHGTRLAAIAAGSPLEEKDFIGAAPESMIAFVKLKQAKPFIRRLQQVPLDSVAYEESDIMLAVRYLDMLAARENKPLIICIALGSNSGGHTGATPLGIYLDDFTRRSGRAVVTASGNEGNKGHHFFGIVPEDTGYLDVELRVGEAEKGFQLNLPSGERIPRSFPQLLSRQRYHFLFENTILDIQYELSEVVSGDERLLMSFQDPAPGIWRLRVFSGGNLENSFHIWLPVSGFISDETYFLRSDPDTTITEPGNASGVLTVAGYDARTNSIWQDSSRGRTRHGLQNLRLRQLPFLP